MQGKAKRLGLLLAAVTLAALVLGLVLGAPPPATVGVNSPDASGTASNAAAAAANGATVVVELQNMQFNPKEVRVAPGTTVVFVNRDPVNHNVVNATPATLGKQPERFRSPELLPGKEFRFTFNEEGVFDVLCDVGGHYLAGMTARIVVTKDAAAGSSSAAGSAGGASAVPAAVRVAKDPADIPPPVKRTSPQTVVVELEAKELVGQLADGVTYTYWTFDGTVPGPMIRVRQGDTVEIRLRNHPDSTQVHSIDLHAVNGPGGGAKATQVAPGEEKAFRFLAMNPGVYVYHCATPYVPLHVSNGMYGLIVVEPPEGLAPVDREFYIMQGDLYTDLRPGETGHAQHDPEAMWREQPNFVVFNGQFQALTGEHAMKAKVGERIRMFVGNGGPNLTSSFHIIGEIFDVVHREAASEAVTNVQTTLIPAGGATWVEFTVDVPGEYVLVDHALGRALGKGAIAVLHVEGPENPDIFQPVP